jgi:hypothetical protein
MRLTIQIDKEINVALLLEQLLPLTSNVGVNLANRELVISTDQPAAVLAAYQAHDSTRPAGTDKALQLRRQEAVKFRAALAGLDGSTELAEVLDTATAEQLLPALRALVRYMAARMASEGE